MKYLYVMAKNAERNIKNLRLWAEPEPVCVLFIVILLSMRDFGLGKTFSAEYIQVVRFFPCLRGGLSASADISRGIMVIIWGDI